MKLQRFIFRSLDRIGYPDALEDRDFLSDCFVDTGYLKTLEDCSRPERIVLGRTGAGKSALLERLYEEQGANARRFQPETLSLSYVSNSTILRTLKEMGVNFDLFFNLLWKHVFAVELIRWRYNITDESSQRSLLDNVRMAFKPRERQALEYLEQFGNRFWIESDERVVEITKHVESKLKAGLGFAADLIGASAEAKGSVTVSEDQRREIRDRAQKIVEEVQVKYLSTIVDLVQRVLDNPQKRWYVLVDKLDENWVDDRIKAQLIRSLIDVARSFRQVENLKIVVALRHDLIDRVFAEARGSGAQREKYQGIFLDIRWQKRQLIDLLDKRVARLVKMRYNTQSVGAKDILPRLIAKQPALDWLVDRTLMRPRDLIAFFNACIENSDGRPDLSAAVIRASEPVYSRGRLDAIYSEWEIDYPNLRILVERLLKDRPPTFSLGDISDEELYELCLDVIASATSGPRVVEDAISLAVRAYEISFDATSLLQVLFAVLFRVGIIGIKISKQSSYGWSHTGERTLAANELTLASRAKIHDCFWRALGVKVSMLGGQGLDPQRI